MSKRAQTLAIELRCWPNPHPQAWEAVFTALLSWDPELQPEIATVQSGPGVSDEEIPWDEPRRGELARLCAGPAGFSWSTGNLAHHFMDVRGTEGRISIGLQVPAPATPVADGYLDLVARLPESNRPELGMLFHFEETDPTRTREGLRRLRFVPPILHLGPRAVAELGGADKLRGAPGEVRDAPGGGLLFVVQPDPFRRPGKEDRARTAAVEAFLGISEETPLALAPREG